MIQNNRIPIDKIGKWLWFGLLLVGGAVIGLLQHAASASDTMTGGSGALEKLKAAYARPTAIPYPKSNPYSQAKAELGYLLFFDPRLSAADNISCGSCHNPSFGWEDPRKTGIGANSTVLKRNTPTVLNLAWAELLFWDGRADSLEEQALGPIQADAEMNMPMPVLTAKIQAIPEYRHRFNAAFGSETITPKAIGDAIATYERTIVSGKAPFDRWIDGEEGAISAAAKRGFVLFNDKAACNACHKTWRFTDDGFHDIGLKSDDIGRGKFVPDAPIMKHAFKTPTLRNIELRAPYMHDGSVATLREVVTHYDTGFVDRDSLSPLMKRLRLTDGETDDLVAFMRSLTSSDAPVALPVLPLPIN